MMFRPSMKVCMKEHSIHLRPPTPTSRFGVGPLRNDCSQPEEAAWLLANTGLCQREGGLGACQNIVRVLKSIFRNESGFARDLRHSSIRQRNSAAHERSPVQAAVRQLISPSAGACPLGGSLGSPAAP